MQLKDTSNHMLTFKIRKELFWDVDYSQLDNKKNKTFIIERVLSLGNLSELKEIFNYYGLRMIKAEIARAGYLDPKTFEFVVSFFNLKKEKMRCYTKKQSHQLHWN
jgi:hypothetical protein